MHLPRPMRLFFLMLLLAPLAAAAPPPDPFARLAALRPYQMDEVLWLARCVLSDEQRLVAWVVRNRVETGYRGTSYREVVLEPYQFSAFNQPSDRRTFLLSLSQTTRGNAAWSEVLGIALDVYGAPASERPFSTTTRHFYSPVSMPGGSTPAWAEGRAPVAVAATIDPDRFQFYDGVDYAADATWTRPGGAAMGAEAAAIRPSEASPQSTRRVGARLDALRARMKTGVRRPQRPTLGQQ